VANAGISQLHFIIIKFKIMTGLQIIFNAMNETGKFSKLQLHENFIYAERPRGARYKVDVNSYGMYRMYVDQGLAFMSSDYEDFVIHFKSIK